MFESEYNLSDNSNRGASLYYVNDDRIFSDDDEYETFEEHDTGEEIEAAWEDLENYEPSETSVRESSGDWETESGPGEGAISGERFTSEPEPFIFAESAGSGTSQESGILQAEESTTYTIDDIYNILDSYIELQEKQFKIIEKNQETMKIISRSIVAVNSIFLGAFVVWLFIGRLK